MNADWKAGLTGMEKFEELVDLATKTVCCAYGQAITKRSAALMKALPSTSVVAALCE